MRERRMGAYYYGFKSTGSEAIDKILGAVACAGKAFHHTQDWEDEASPYDDHTGQTPAEWIQNAAIEAVNEIKRLRAEVQEQARLNGMGAERELALQAKVERLRKALGIIVDLCDGYDPPASLAASVARAALAEQEKISE